MEYFPIVGSTEVLIKCKCRRKLSPKNMKQVFFNILNKSQKENEGEAELQEYFNTLLNPTKTCSLEETAQSHRTEGEGFRGTNQFHSGSAAGLDEVQPEYLMALDVVLDGMPLQRCLWTSGAVPMEWLEWWSFSSGKRTRRCVPKSHIHE